MAICFIILRWIIYAITAEISLSRENTKNIFFADKGICHVDKLDIDSQRYNGVNRSTSK